MDNFYTVSECLSQGSSNPKLTNELKALQFHRQFFKALNSDSELHRLKKQELKNLRTIQELRDQIYQQTQTLKSLKYNKRKLKAKMQEYSDFELAIELSKGGFQISKGSAQIDQLAHCQDSQAVCLLCFERVNSTGKVLPCTHTFHTDCIHRSLQNKNECPYCLEEI